MNYIIYCRKSTDSEDKQVLSIDAQERELLELAKKENLPIVKIFKESKSAKDVGRPVFAEMIEFIKKGKAQGILTWKIDRLARNLVDGGTIIDLLQRSTVLMIRTHDRVCLPSDNVLMLAVEFGMANQFVRDLSANVKRGYREKLNRGEWPHHPALGYKHDRLNKLIVVDEERAKYVVRAYELYLTKNHSFIDIANILYEEGLRTNSGKKVYRGNVQRILQNPFYTGIMLKDGKYYPGKHTPLISKTKFDLAQEIADGRSRPRPKLHFFPLRGFMRCGSCDCLLTASLKKGHHYYYCTNGKGACTEHKSYMRENYLYPIVANLLSEIHFDEEIIEIMYEAARERLQTNSSYHQQTLGTLKTSLDSSRAKESRLLDSYLAGQIPQALYEEKMLSLGNEITATEEQIKKVSKMDGGDEFTLELVRNIFLEASRATNEFLDATDEGKNKMLEKLLWNLSIKNKNIHTYQFKSIYQVLAKAPKKADILTLGDGQTSNITCSAEDSYPLTARTWLAGILVLSHYLRKYADTSSHEDMRSNSYLFGGITN